jgi:hypothetical protein
MKSYMQLFSNPSDVICVWLLVVGWLVTVSALLRRRFSTVNIHSERNCSTTALAFLFLELIIMFTFLIGLFMMWLKIESIFWLFWELAFLLSVICVFAVLPIITTCLLGWSLIGKWKANYSPLNLRLTLLCLLAMLIDGGLYFGLQRSF